MGLPSVVGQLLRCAIIKVCKGSLSRSGVKVVKTIEESDWNNSSDDLLINLKGALAH